MKTRNLKLIAQIALVAGFAGSAAAAPAPPIACSLGDLTGVSVFACEGYASGNLISNNSSSRDAVADFLDDLGLAGQNGDWLEKLPSLSGHLITFDTPLYGVSFIGVHKGGGGQGGQGTAFYRFDAGDTGITSLGYALNGLSNAALYQTQAAPAIDLPPVTAVPEPGTIALMLVGLSGVALARRRQRS